MHRIDGPTAAPGGFWTEGDPVGGVPATIVSDDFMNDTQENICKVIEDAGITLVKGDYTQLTAAIKATVNTTRINVASAATINLTTAAPNTQHINVTGTTTINGFTVAAGRTYFVRFNAALTLTNSASLVTQTGANIITVAGDTCIIRATAANVVEVLCYVSRAIGDGQTWQNLTASRASGVTYTNTTGRAIIASVTNNSTPFQDMSFLVNGVAIMATNSGGSTFSQKGNLTAVVPIGATYSCVIATGALTTWFELRV